MRLILERERQHRDNVGYPRILESGVPNEHYVYRRGILKKFVMSVLFLEVKREKETHRVSDTVGAIAAGLAMVFAVATAVWAERRYGLNTGPFFGALVVSYILKDRIKEWVKRYSSRFLSRFTSDYRLEIMDPRNDRSVGVSRETFSFVSSGDIPDDVYSCRHGGAPNSIEARSKREICLKYEKEIILKGKIIDQHHGRLLDVNDIMRFKLGRLLDGADDPLSRVRLYNVKTRQIERVECPKVYHINVIFVLKADRGKEQYDTGLQARIICDRNGIRRLDLVTNHEKP